MKRILCILLTSLLLVSAAPMCTLAADAACRIVIPAQATPQERAAAETLQRYLTRITGTAPVLQPDDGDTNGADFSVGRTKLLPAQEDELPDGGYRIERKNGGTVCIRGSGNKGNLNGVYAFLRDYCGCRWYAHDLTVVPSAALSLPDTIDVRYAPFFEYADTDWWDAYDGEYALANGVNGGYATAFPAEQGGSVEYIYGFCHTLSTRFCSRDEYFETHPEYFALHDGKRSPNQLCLTNPDTLRVVTEEVLDVLRRLHDPDADLQIISITQDDNGDYCECPSCKALDDENGSHAGTNITFANAVADAVKAAGYDNVAIDTFAYQYTRKTPTHVVPRDNVIVRLCSIECCFCHTLDDESCQENRDFMRDLHDWGEICERIYIWDYTTNYWETICLYPDFGVLQRNVQIFYENNVKGVFEEGNGGRDTLDAEFGSLRCYLLVRLMQNPYLDFDAEMRAFLDAFYGDGGEPIYRFLTRVTEKAGASYAHHLGAFPDSTETLTAFTAADVAFAEEQWREAKEKTQGSAYYARVERSELCWRFWKSENRRAEFSPFRTTLYMRMRERETLYNDLVRMHVSYITLARRNREITECMSLVLLRCPGKWCKLYEEPFWDAIEPLVLRLYDALGKLHGVLFPNGSR